MFSIIYLTVGGQILLLLYQTYKLLCLAKLTDVQDHELSVLKQQLIQMQQTYSQLRIVNNSWNDLKQDLPEWIDRIEKRINGLCDRLNEVVNQKKREEEQKFEEIKQKHVKQIDEYYFLKMHAVEEFNNIKKKIEELQTARDFFAASQVNDDLKNNPVVSTQATNSFEQDAQEIAVWLYDYLCEYVARNNRFPKRGMLGAHKFLAKYRKITKKLDAAVKILQQQKKVEVINSSNLYEIQYAPIIKGKKSNGKNQSSDTDTIQPTK